MSEVPTIHQVADRIKNLSRSKGAALTEHGVILCNMYTHVLMSFYEFAASLPQPHSDKLAELVKSKENLPFQVISLATPKEDDEEA